MPSESRNRISVGATPMSQHGPAAAAVVAALLAGSSACIPPTPHTYLIERSALVPVPAPDLMSGPPAGHVEVGAGDATVLWTSPPKLSPDSTAGLYVPRHEPVGVLRVPVSTYFHMRYNLEIAPSRGAYAVIEGSLGPPSLTTFTTGPGIGIAGYVTHSLWLGLSLDTMVTRVAARMRVTCLDCDGAEGVAFGEEEAAWVPSLRAQISGGFDLGPVQLSLAIALRNHPINEASSMVTSIYVPDPTPRVTAGPVLVVPGFVLAFRPVPELAIIASAYQPIDFSRTAVRYGPIVGLAVSAAVPPAGGGPAARTRAARPGD